MKYTTNHPQIHYEFKDWEKAFYQYFKSESIYGDDLRLVISVGEYNSGYYIESKGWDINPAYTFVYNTKEEVAALKARTEKEIIKAKVGHRTPKLIT